MKGRCINIATILPIVTFLFDLTLGAPPARARGGIPLWTNRYHGPTNSYSVAKAVAVDGDGSIFVTGYSYGTNNNSDFATIAYSGAGLPLWTNRCHGPVDDYDAASAVAVDGSGNVLVTGWSRTTINGSDSEFVTIKYSSIGPPPVHLTIERDGGSGYFIRYTGAPGSTHHLQRAPNLTGPWSNLATNTAPLSGFVDFHETNPPAGAGFYRTAQP